MPRPNPSLLESKFQPQLGPRTQVNRMRLAVPEALLQGSARAASVVAPTGYGKTTLMAQWHGTLSSVQPARVDVAWFNLDENDNDPPRLLRYLYAALGRRVPALAADAVQEISRTANLSVILEDLSVRLAAHGQPVVLFLDDLHEITDGDAARALEWLLRYAGTHLRLVVGSRQALGWPQAELRLRGQLIETNGLFLRATDALKEKERELIDYYAVDLVEMASYLTNSWLLLQDASPSPRKQDLARAYASEHLPHIHSHGEAILNANATPLQVRETVLSSEF